MESDRWTANAWAVLLIATPQRLVKAHSASPAQSPLDAPVLPFHDYRRQQKPSKLTCSD